MKYSGLTLLLAAALTLTAGGAAAEKADRDKPMNVEADSLRYDDVHQTSVFSGKVQVTKGSITIRGARIEVRQDPEGFQRGVVTAEPGKLAYFRQKRDGVDEYIEGQSQTIEYDGRTDRVKFIGQAQMRRYRGTVLSDEMTGSLITYDNTTDVFSVDGGASAPGGRVRATLGPRTGAAAPAPAPSSAATPAGKAQGGERK